MTKLNRAALPVQFVRPIRIGMLAMLILMQFQSFEDSMTQAAPGLNSPGLQSSPANQGASEVLDDQARNAQTRSRLVYASVGAFGVVSLLSILFVYLRLNHATRGFYSRRLQIGAGVVTVIVLLACLGLISILK